MNPIQPGTNVKYLLENDVSTITQEQLLCGLREVTDYTELWESLIQTDGLEKTVTLAQKTFCLLYEKRDEAAKITNPTFLKGKGRVEEWKNDLLKALNDSGRTPEYISNTAIFEKDFFQRVEQNQINPKDYYFYFSRHLYDYRNLQYEGSKKIAQYLYKKQQTFNDSKKGCFERAKWSPLHEAVFLEMPTTEIQSRINASSINQEAPVLPCDKGTYTGYRTPLAIAQTIKNQEIEQLLRQNGAIEEKEETTQPNNNRDQKAIPPWALFLIALPLLIWGVIIYATAKWFFGAQSPSSAQA